MARRYGRNQRRQHRAEIEALTTMWEFEFARAERNAVLLAEAEAALKRELRADFIMASQASNPLVIPDAVVSEFDDNTRGEREGGGYITIRRQCQVRVYPEMIPGFEEKILESHRQRFSIVFRGLAWQLHHVEVQHGPVLAVELALVAIGRQTLEAHR